MEIDILTTEEYNNKGDNSYYETQEVADYVQYEWNYWMATNNHITTYEWSQYAVEVPESQIKSDVSSSDDLSDRRDDIHDYLSSEWSRYDDLTCEGVIVLDYIDQSNVPLGQASIGTAGKKGGLFADYSRVAVVNMAKYPRPGNKYHRDTQHYGTAFHELLHLYGVRHIHGTLRSEGKGSFILPSTYEPGKDTSCNEESDNLVKREEYLSVCSQRQIRDHTGY